MVALLLGALAGLRTMTPPAALSLVRGPSPAAAALAVLALAEYAGDLHPRAPARTAFAPLAARICSGAYCGWCVSGSATAPAVAGAALGAAGAVAGAFIGLALRERAAARIGAVPAALGEDAIAAAGALLLAQRWKAM